jgi:hypothetical protein
MRVTTQNRLRRSWLGERRGLFDGLNCDKRTVFGPKRSFDFHNAIFDLSAIGHD